MGQLTIHEGVPEQAHQQQAEDHHGPLQSFFAALLALRAVWPSQRGL